MATPLAIKAAGGRYSKHKNFWKRFLAGIEVFDTLHSFLSVDLSDQSYTAHLTNANILTLIETADSHISFSLSDFQYCSSKVTLIKLLSSTTY
jgi:hypothetical protein